jgi:lysophospholipase L1-like esterase
LHKRTLSLRKRLIFLLIFFGLIILAAEGILRLYVTTRGWTPNCYAAHLQLFNPHPVNGYDLSPNFKLRSGTFQISMNSMGLRGPEILINKPIGTTRIAILGGSAAYGYLVSDGEEASRLLEKQLHHLDVGDVEVINAGVPGYDLFQSIVRFREVVDPLQPDIVVLYLGYNDIRYLLSETPETFQNPRQPPYPFWERWLRHSTLYGFVRYRILGGATDFGIGRRTQNLPTDKGIAQFRRNLNEIMLASHEIGAELVVCVQATAAQPSVSPELRAVLGNTDVEVQRAIQIFEAIHHTLDDFAKKQDALFIDVSAAVPPTSQNLGDAIHLTAIGEQALADLLTKQLQHLLKKIAVSLKNQTTLLQRLFGGNNNLHLASGEPLDGNDQQLILSLS